jgi:hypothetical protein
MPCPRPDADHGTRPFSISHPIPHARQSCCCRLPEDRSQRGPAPRFPGRNRHAVTIVGIARLPVRHADMEGEARAWNKATEYPSMGKRIHGCKPRYSHEMAATLPGPRQIITERGREENHREQWPTRTGEQGNGVPLRRDCRSEPFRFVGIHDDPSLPRRSGPGRGEPFFWSRYSGEAPEVQEAGE